jgi:selenocysteine lyase/cysteine desulfurase
MTALCMAVSAGSAGGNWDMRQPHRFCPGIVEGLEDRLALSRGVTVAPVVVGKVPAAQHQSATHAVVNNINLAFTAFTADYLQAEGAYLASDSKSSEGVFRTFVGQRVNLLAAQLTRVFAHIPGSLSLLQTSSSGGPVVLQNFLRTRINGDDRSSLLTALVGRGSLVGAVPPYNASGPTATLYTDQATTAIETAQATTINCVAFLYSQSFQHK